MLYVSQRVRPVPKGIDLPKTKYASIEDMALVPHCEPTPIFTYGVACGAIRSINSKIVVDVVVVLSSPLLLLL